MRRANDPQRREKIVQAALDAVIVHGIHGVIHRKTAMIAEVLLGSMTYYSPGIDELLMETFGRFTDRMMLQYQDFFADVKNVPQVCRAITDMIYGSQAIAPDNMELTYQPYTFASRKPALKTAMQSRMLRSQRMPEQWFDPVTTWVLDAFIEGVTLHFVANKKPLQREDISLMMERIAGIPTTISCMQCLR